MDLLLSRRKGLLELKQQNNLSGLGEHSLLLIEGIIKQATEGGMYEY